MGVGSHRRVNKALAANKGFTLTELLVVIVVIGVIAAIVYPVIIKVKETAKISECLSNMRQMGQGMHMYLDQYDDRFPSAVRAGAPAHWDKYGQKTIQELLSPYVRNGMKPNVVRGDVTYDKGGVFCCPSDVGLTEDEMNLDSGDKLWGIHPGHPIWKYAGCSYQYFADNQEDRFAYDPKPIMWTALSPLKDNVRLGAPYSSVVKTSKKAIISDIGFWHMGDRIPGPRIAYVNTLFADGHAARVRGAEHNDARIATLRQWCDMY